MLCLPYAGFLRIERKIPKVVFKKNDAKNSKKHLTDLYSFMFLHKNILFDMDLFSSCFYIESPYSLAQEYLVHKLSNNKLNKIIFNFRCQTSKNVKNNFHTQNMDNLGCIFNCVGEIDSQENILTKVKTRAKYRTTKPTQLSFIQPNIWEFIRSTEDF